MRDAATGPNPTPIPEGLFAGAPLALREREYSPSSCIGGDYRPFVAAYRQRSDEARRAAAAMGGRWSRQACGAAPAQGLELCMPPGTGSATPVPLLLFVHGGYWQELSAADSLFAAAACVRRGWAFAALDYTLAPAATLEGIVAECRQALAWLGTQAAALGIARDRVVIAGSSAGAHLCAAMSIAASGDAKPPATMAPAAPIVPRALVLISGIYWLAPLIGTSIDGALALDAAGASRASPGLSPLAGFPRALLCWGEIETRAFKAQSRAFANRLRERGRLCEELEVPGRNHFDVVLELADPVTELGRKAFALLD